MEPQPVLRQHLEFLASRLAWSRLLPGLVLIAVGIAQPFAVIQGEDDDLVAQLSVSAVLGRTETLDNDGPAAVFAVLLIIAVLALAGQSLAALADRTERARRITVGLAVLVLVLGVFAVVGTAAVEPLQAAPGDSVERATDLTVSSTAQGPVPLLLGAVAVWAAAARAKRPERFLERSICV